MSVTWAGIHLPVGVGLVWSGFDGNSVLAALAKLGGTEVLLIAQISLSLRRKLINLIVEAQSQ